MTLALSRAAFDHQVTARGLDPDQVAERTGTPLTVLNRRLAGEMPTRLQDVGKLALALDVEPGALLEWRK